MAIDPTSEAWLEMRSIEIELALRYGVKSARHPVLGDTLAIPYFRDGKIFNHKYRRLHDKAFMQDKGADKALWNVDVVYDKGLVDFDLLITEGEMDALSAIQSGYPRVVSAPDGAPPPPKKNPLDPKKDEPQEIDPENDRKYSFIHRDIDGLLACKGFILACDADAPGQLLQQELRRRLGAARCKYVLYPDGCKDLNDVLMKHGQDAVRRCINEAKPVPLTGVYGIDDYVDEQRKLYDSGWAWFDDYMKFYRKMFIPITGIPGAGKSTFTRALSFQLGWRHGLRTAMGSFEDDIKPTVINELRRWHNAESGSYNREAADNFIRDHFAFIDGQKEDDLIDEMIDIDWFLDRAAECVQRYGSDVIICDPFNELEQSRRRNENETDYIGRAIKEIKRFSRRFEVIFFCVAHPDKAIRNATTGKIRKPSLYDISGSAHWNNKADAGLSLWRGDNTENHFEVSVEKAPRFRAAGRKGRADFRLKENGTYGDYVPSDQIDMDYRAASRGT